VCGTTNVAAGTPTLGQTPGDCHHDECDGSGGVRTVVDDADVPDDNDACTTDACSGGAPSHTALASGASCGQNLTCDASGACTGCTADADCPGQDTVCKARKCTAGACGFTFTSAGVPAGTQTAGDCHEAQCDGSGNAVVVVLDADVRADGNPCTQDLCTHGIPSNPLLAVGSACNGSDKCDASGSCVACLVNADCGADTACKKFSCAGGACSTSSVAAGTKVADPTAGDCKSTQCDGAGNAVQNQPDANDLPVDGNACTQDVCSGGTASNPPVASGTACGGSNTCDGAGHCVGCLQASDCGTDTACKSFTCDSGACATHLVGAGTKVADPTAGDCKSTQCDGAGNVAQNQPDGADLPVDGNPCTKDVCAAGIAGNPFEAVGTACGGSNKCDGAGHCVACLQASDCGTSAACKSFTCDAGVCNTHLAASGTVVTNATAGDCRSDQCDGAGNLVSSAVDAADLPADDGNACTLETCAGGAPAHPPAPLGTACTQGGGSICDGSGVCVKCTADSQCPAANECQIPACSSGTCGFTPKPSGTVTAAQTDGDCQKNQCDGAGHVVSVADDADLPADDGSQCTADICTAGVPSHPVLPADSACNQNGGQVCSAAGACVACNAASQCPGVDDACQARTCIAHACGVAYAAAGTRVAAQTAGDCQANVCDGAGHVHAVADDSDLPADDGNACTGETCVAGAPAHPNLPADTACQGSRFCDGAGACVECNQATQCAGTDDDCQNRTCLAHACGMYYQPSGTPVSSQLPGDCQQIECDGAGASASAPLDTDLPPSDGNPCTTEACAGGVPAHDPLPAGTSCGANLVCDPLANCVTPPSVLDTTPHDRDYVGPTVSVTFSRDMDPATLWAQDVAGPCDGTLQASLDGFQTCIAFPVMDPTMSAGTSVATIDAAPGLLVERPYQIRVKADAADPNGVPLGADYTSAVVTLRSHMVCEQTVVISQIYGGGALSNAVYKNDYVVLHNLGADAVDMTGWSIQYGAAGLSTWTAAPLSTTAIPKPVIPGGGYFLVQLAGGSAGQALPTADLIASPAINMSATSGKVALVADTTLVTGQCPSGNVVDYVGYGSANCTWSTPVAALTVTTAAVRNNKGCLYTGYNNVDFAPGTPAPVSSASPASVCACGTTPQILNESGHALEADLCGFDGPTGMTENAFQWSSNYYGFVTEAGVTGSGSSLVRAEIGYGPPTSNPQYESGWSWNSTWYDGSDPGTDWYAADFYFTSPGTYAMAFRVSLDNGDSWTYCDADWGADGGSGSSPGASFDLTELGTVTVQ
jgi:hypothetical protein